LSFKESLLLIYHMHTVRNCGTRHSAIDIGDGAQMSE